VGRASHSLWGVLCRVLLRVLSLACSVSLSVFIFLLRFGLVNGEATCISTSVWDGAESYCAILSSRVLLLVSLFMRSCGVSRSMICACGLTCVCFPAPMFSPLLLELCALRSPCPQFLWIYTYPTYPVCLQCPSIPCVSWVVPEPSGSVVVRHLLVCWYPCYCRQMGHLSLPLLYAARHPVVTSLGLLPPPVPMSPVVMIVEGSR
jgi:hypothetical protein